MTTLRARSQAIFVRTEGPDDEQVEEMVTTTVQEFGALDIAFTSAGIPGGGLTHEYSRSSGRIRHKRGILHRQFKGGWELRKAGTRTATTVPPC
jgi:NAD(P)-dependent dehydrogenase (short-subunit alcohol dehydrogenase family)